MAARSARRTSAQGPKRLAGRVARSSARLRLCPASRIFSHLGGVRRGLELPLAFLVVTVLAWRARCPHACCSSCEIRYPRVSRAVLFVRYILICILYIHEYCIISIYLSIYHTTHIHTRATCMRLHAHECVRLCLCVKHGHECLFDCARK
jgi:hypothetical protein